MPRDDAGPGGPRTVWAASNVRMCGIWGYLGRGASVPIDDAWQGLCSLTDRGPDDWGVFVEDSGKITSESNLPDGDAATVLGNRRLSILDLSPAGNQPMTADGRYWLVYNGEVYNYRELRTELKAAGHEFTSDSDTEVVLRGYLEYGDACVTRFRGMFAFAIWDREDERLFAARDRFGIKPFYYGHDDDRLVFASEVTSLLDAGVSERKPDPEAIDGFLAFGSVPSPMTIVDGIRSLPPGCILQYDRSTGDLDCHRYWEPSFDEDEIPVPSRVEELLSDSVALRLRSDVPVGAFLSGGLDSSAVVAAMRANREASSSLRTFSIGFEESDYSETEFAESVARAFGTDHVSRTVTAADVRDHLPDIVAAMDQPTIDGVNTYFVSHEAAQEGLRVALTGLGSDELFFGYPTFWQVSTLVKLDRAADALPKSLRSGLAKLARSIGTRLLGARASTVADVIESPSNFGAAYVAARGLYPSSERAELLERSGVRDWASDVEATVERTLDQSSIGNAVSHAELAWYLHNQLLRDTDSMSMAHSLEVRVPLLDTALAEHVTGTPTEEKRIGEKQLLEDAVRERLPADVVEREKSGFTFPFEAWLADELETVVDRALTRDRFDHLPLDHAAVESVRQRFDRGDVHWSRLWALVVLSLWFEEHIADDSG